MSSNEKNLEISFEQDMPAIAAAGENYVIPMPAISRRAFLMGGTNKIEKNNTLDPMQF